MPFYRILNEIMEELHCSARNLASKSGLSAAAVSRYRRGERVPAPDTDAFAALSRALCAIAQEQGKADFAAQIESKLKSADDMPVYIADGADGILELTLADLLPYSFGKEYL